jgi:ribosomal protein L16
MLFTPKNNKFRKFKKYHRAKVNRHIFKNISYPSLLNGVVGLKVLSFGFITSTELKTIRQIINKSLKKIGHIQFFAFPNAALSTKPTSARMGKGKGVKIKTFVYKVPAGFLLCEINTSNTSKAIYALNSLRFRMSLPTKVVINNFK